MKSIVFSLLFLGLIITTSWAQSKSVERFQQQHKTAQALYFYPSTLRMINLDKNPDYNALVSNVNKLQFLTFGKKEEPIRAEAVQQLKQDIQKEHYQELLSMDNKNSRVYMYALGEETTEGMVGIIDNPQTLTLIDLDGFVDMPSLLRLMQSDFDFGKVAKIMTTTADKQNQPRERRNNQKNPDDESHPHD